MMAQRGRPPIPIEEKIRRLEAQKHKLEERRREEALARWGDWTKEQLNNITPDAVPLSGPLALGMREELLPQCSEEFRSLWAEWERTAARVHALARELQGDRDALGGEFPRIRQRVLEELSLLAREWQRQLQVGIQQEIKCFAEAIITEIEERVAEVPPDQRVLWLALEKLRADTQRAELINREFISPGEAWAVLQLRGALRAEVLPHTTESSTAASNAVKYLVGEEKADIIRKLQRIHDSLGEPARLHALLDPIRKI